MFAGTSFWNQRLPSDVPIDANSAAVVANLKAQADKEGSTFEFRDWSLTLWEATPQTPLQKVWLDVADGTQSNMRSMLAKVPVPAGMRPPGPWPTGDHALAIYLPDYHPELGYGDAYWEMHGARYIAVDGPKAGVEGCTTLEEPGWHCDNAAGIQTARTSPGYWEDKAWPAVTGVTWGCSGSGLFLWPGPITIAEAQAGVIRHPIRFECPNIRTTFRWPAQKSDGKTETASDPQEGMIFKFKKDYDLSGIKDSFVKIVCEAIRDYGLILTDRASNVSIKCASQATVPNSQTYATDAWKGAEDKFGSPGAILSKVPTELAPTIPWADLQLVSTSYRPNIVKRTRLRIA